MANFKYKPNNLFAGPFPVVTEIGTAAEDIKKYTPITAAMKAVAKNSGSDATFSDVIGIAAEDVSSGEEIVYYCTGEFFAESINMPAGTTIEDVRTYCRKLNIYFR